MLNKQKKENNHLYLVDGHALCYRAFYAIKELSNSKGMPTNAIYGVIIMLKKLIKDYSPSMLAFAFDSKGKTLRHDKYDQYKIQRKPMPEDLSSQIPAIMDIIKAYRIPIFQIQGYEADDIIATIAKKAEKEGTDVTIVTNDKDALQLVNEHIRVLSPGSFGDKIYGVDEVRKKYGVSPEQMKELMALTGDTSDNIPGVKGIGKITAAKLISKYGNLSSVFENIEAIPQKNLREKLTAGKKSAQMSKDLVMLDLQVPVNFDLKEAVFEKGDIEKLISLFRDFEFHKLLKELVETDTGNCKYSIISSEENIKELVGRIKKNKIFSFSVSYAPSGKVQGLSISTEPETAFFIPLRGLNNMLPEIKDIFKDSSITRVSYDIKNDIHFITELGYPVSKNNFDIMLADYLIDPTKTNYDLESIAIRSLGHVIGKKENISWDVNGQGSIDLESDPTVIKYCEISDIVLRLFYELYPRLKEMELLALFYNVEMPLTEVLADMESTGIGVDLPYIEKKSRELESEIKVIKEKICSMAGETFNINSTKQLQTVLFEKIGLPVLKRTKTGASTDESVLIKLSSMHKLPALLIKYRELTKLKTGYYDSIRNIVFPDGHIHAKFNQAVTATGRLSSSEPNLQNIPIKTEIGRDIRKAFIPSQKRHVLLSADYSQIELRILAHLSKDEGLIAALKKGKDIHAFTASLIFDCDENKVTTKMRSVAKTVNFGIAYGMSAFGLSKDLDIPIKEAQCFIEAYFERYKNIKKFMDGTISSAKKKGYVSTIMNRRRFIPGINSSNERIKSFSERVAINTPVQGSAADLIKLAMIRCFKRFAGSKVKMLIQVHDELVFEIPEKDLICEAGKIKNIMETVFDLDVPLKIDLESGPNWRDISPLFFDREEPAGD